MRARLRRAGWLGALGGALVACRASASTPAPRPSEMPEAAPHPSPEADVTRPTILQTLDGLCAELTTGAPTPGASVAAQLGAVTMAGRSAIHLSMDALFSKATVGNHRDGTVRWVTLDLQEPTEVGVALAERWGPPRWPPLGGDGRHRATWPVDLGPGHDRVCVVEAVYAGAADRDTAAGAVTQVGLRVDIRL